MKTREQLRDELELANPFTQIGNTRYRPGDAVYEALMERWIDAMQQTKLTYPDVEMYQIHEWMIENNLDPDSVGQVISAVYSAGKERKKALSRWNKAIRVPRNHPLVNVIGGQMGLTPEQIDAAWEGISQL